MKSIFYLPLLLLLSCASFAQESRATLSGLVTDPTAAPIVGAKVTVMEVRTGTKIATVSDSAGQYNVPFLAAGDYEINAEAPGFKLFHHSAVHIESSSHAVIDIRLQVGNTSESVTVTAEAPLINAADASIGQGITTQQVEDFPLNGRNPIMVTQLAIGVVATGNPTLVHPFDNGATAAWSMGGTPSQTAEILMDGAPNATWDNRSAYSPPQDAVQEVKVKSFDSDAAYGHTASGTINEVMKTGTNRFHGSLYEFTQPASLAAKSFFSTLRQSTKYNQYGLTAGGPVLIPKLFNGRNKLLWFFAWENLKDSQPNPKPLTVPTNAERQGDFSALSGITQIYNPYSGVLNVNPNGTTFVTRTRFMCDSAGNPLTPNSAGIQPNGTPCNKIPQQLLNPVALAYLKFYPQPNAPGSTLQPGYSNYSNIATTKDDYSNELGRLDWSMSDRSRLAFNIRHNSEFQSKNNYFGNNTTGSDLVRDNWGATADEVFVINSSTVLNVRANFTRLNEFHPSPSAGFDATSLGFPAYITSSSRYLQLPQIGFGSSCGNDTTQAASFDCFSATGADRIPSQSYQLFTDVVKQWGAHSFKFGVDARQYKLDAQSFGASAGSYTFAGIGAQNAWTNGPTATSAPTFGEDFAEFLLGLPTSGNFDVNPRGTYTGYYYGLFLQDDWRVSKTLTLNLGLRYDHDTPYSEKQGRTVNGFNSAATTTTGTRAAAAYGNTNNNPLLPPTSAFNVPGGLTFPSPSAGDVYSNTSHLLSPRVGFAWSPEMFGGKMVVRGGFGLFVQPITLANLAPTGSYSTSPILTQEGFSARTQLSVLSNFLLPDATLSNPFPSIQPPVGSAAGLETFFGQSIDFLAPRARSPYSERWTFGVQQELRPDLLLEVVYIGNHSVHLPISVTQLNGIPRALLSRLPYRDQNLINSFAANTANPFRGLIPSVSSFNGTTIAVRQLTVPFPQYPFADSTSFSSGVVEHNANLGSSSFNSLNVRVQKRMGRGLQVATTYIWSKLIEQDSWLNNTDTVPERRISPFDHTHRFVTAVNYDLPIGNGKLLNVGSGWMNRVLGGWRINGIFTYQRGAPLTFMNGSTNNPGDYAFCSVPTAKGTRYKVLAGLCMDENGNLLAPAILSPATFDYNARRVIGTAFDTSHFITGTTPAASNVPGVPNSVLANAQSTGQFLYHLRTLPTTFSSLRQDGQNNLDASIIKRIDIAEQTYLQLRMEAFNILNHPTFGAPNLQATSANFGIINTQANRPRQLQLGVRFVF